MNIFVSDKNKKKPNPLPRLIYCLIAVLIIGIVAITAINKLSTKKEPEIITTATLKEIINVSELATYQAYYNGIAQVMDEKKTDKVDYYVYYEATIKAGINFEEVEINIDNKAKTISVTLPEIEIYEPTVPMSSLDFIFEDDRKNKVDDLEKAHNACKEDVANEIAAEEKFKELAEENAKQTVEALLRPFISQLDAEYTLNIH